MNLVVKMRRFAGLTQTDVAKILKVSLQTYYKKENGKTPFNDDEKIILKELFSKDFPEVTIDELFFNQKVSKVESEVN
ncbi:helix-turn-helix transcriptional regulator [Vagococcus carniphilus]|uniref:helix-turn-helix transcriptional regulator n=1 Tax=Vagococcus carniphilus TaxID=218144 RepID=UPI00289191FE|nr:hypothetical protein [Vagococcus carniphilus]MDT2864286.1 hypothetical protein [Vagococcus carniphilus]